MSLWLWRRKLLMISPGLSGFGLEILELCSFRLEMPCFKRRGHLWGSQCLYWYYIAPNHNHIASAGFTICIVKLHYGKCSNPAFLACDPDWLVQDMCAFAVWFWVLFSVTCFLCVSYLNDWALLHFWNPIKVDRFKLHIYLHWEVVKNITTCQGCKETMWRQVSNKSRDCLI